MEIFLNCVKAFLVGGAFCLIGQVLIDYTKLTPARILVGYIVGGVVLSAVGLYGPIKEFAGAGATVPLLGFGHLLAEGVRQAVDSEAFFGIITGGLSSAAGGIAVAVLSGFVCALIFRSKERK